MNTRTAWLLSPLLLALAACTAPRDPEAVGAPADAADATAPAEPAPATPAPPAGTTPPPAEPPAMATCDADAANAFIGQAASADVVEQARAAAGAAVARTLAPGQVVTMEFRGDRLNLMVDEANVVTGVRCG
jgi:hypothetical protein